MKKVPASRIKAAEIAREAWSIKPDQKAVRGSLRVPANLESVFEEQSSEDRGDTWTDGHQFNQELGLLYEIAAKLNRSELPSFIVDSDGVTIVLGQLSETAPTQAQALLKLLKTIVREASK